MGGNNIVRRLPQECIAYIVSLTTPRDACRAALVSHSFQETANSDATWEAFLPSDYREIVSTSPAAAHLFTLSKMQLFLHLSDHPILINNGTMSFALHRESGKKCYMKGARDLTIIWGSSPEYWQWVQLPESRFGRVAWLWIVWWFHVEGRIRAQILSPQTNYVAYLVFRLEEPFAGFQRNFESKVYFDGMPEHEIQRRDVVLDPLPDMPQEVRDRGDGWMEIEMGEFFNQHGDDNNSTIVFSLVNTQGFHKRGLVIEGIELRPRNMN